MKKLIFLFLGIGLVALSSYFLFRDKFLDITSDQEQLVLQETYDLSKEYLLLRNRTDNILVKAKDYADYASWEKNVILLIKDWESLVGKSQELENSAAATAEIASIDFKLIKKAQAYSAKEITDIYDKAPKFKGIATLAKHLGVDAQRAQLILNQAQNETTAEGWTEAGDTLQKLETSAIVIKDGCKVAGFVGGVVLTGGVAGLATAGTLTTTTTVVVGVDLALEVTEDGAQIAFGDKNKVSSFVKDIRNITEPIANVLTITNIPSNLGTAFGKFDSAMIGLEQFRESAQEGKVIGIDLTNFAYHPPFQVIRKTKYPEEVTVAEMDKAEVEEWLKSLKKEYKPMTETEVNEFLSSSDKESKQVEIGENAENVVKNSVTKDVKDENKTKETENNEKANGNTDNTQNQIYKIVNVSGSSYMMDACLSSTCWDDLDADPAEDRDLGGIYTLGKVFADGESFRSGFRPPEVKASGKLIETSANSYKITIYLAIAPFEGPKHKTIDYGTWLSKSIEIEANYGDEPVIEWDGSSLKQVK